MARNRVKGPRRKPRAAPRPLPEVLTTEELDTLIGGPPSPKTHRYAKQLRDRALLAVIYDGALRVSEARGLRLSDLPKEGWGWYKIVGKGQKQRWAKLYPCHAPMVKAWIEVGRPRFADPDTEDWLFINREGGPLHIRSMERIIAKRAQKRLGKQVWAHVLRHTCATHLYEGGAPLRIVQTYLGHANIATTEIYTHVSTRFLGEVLDRCHHSGDGGSSDAPPALDNYEQPA